MTYQVGDIFYDKEIDLIGIVIKIDALKVYFKTLNRQLYSFNWFRINSRMYRACIVYGNSKKLGKLLNI